MNDDLNTAIALSVMFDAVRLANELIENKNTTAHTLDLVDIFFRELGADVLGIVKPSYAETDEPTYYMLARAVELLIEQRNEARRKKYFLTADTIRDKLSEIGIMLEDKPEETTWRIK